MDSLKEIVQGVQGIPDWRKAVIDDVNPLGGSSKKRMLHIPNEALKQIQRKFVDFLRPRTNENVRRYATGCFPGCSPVVNVSLHKNNRFFFVVDLKNAYSNVNIERMLQILPSMLNISIEEARDFLSRYCFVPEHGLMTGSCCSPDLFNIYCYYKIDIKIKQSRTLGGYTYSRYLDDLTFSSNMPFSKDERKFIRRIINGAGFQINHRKCRLFDIRKGPITINGVGLKKNRTIFLPRFFMRRINGLIHKASKTYDWNLWMKVEGMMGIFKMLTRRSYNRTEKKLISSYLNGRERLRKARVS